MMFDITTNVDDLSERAGCQNVTHLHGDIREVITHYNWVDEEVVSIGYEKAPSADPHLRPVKPNVVFFGEAAPRYEDLGIAYRALTGKQLLTKVRSFLLWSA